MEIFTLRKTIDIDGKKVSELKYDFEEMTAKDKIEAGRRMKGAGVQMTVDMLDTDYHLYLFAAAAVKADPAVDYPDVFRMSAKDATRAGALARNFFFMDSEESQMTETSSALLQE